MKFYKETKKPLIQKNVIKDNENYNSKREDLEEEDQGEDERNVIL